MTEQKPADQDKDFYDNVTKCLGRPAVLAFVNPDGTLTLASKGINPQILATMIVVMQMQAMAMLQGPRR